MGQTFIGNCTICFSGQCHCPGHQFDIIHAHDWLAYPGRIAAKQASGKPLVIHVHATDFDRSGGTVNPNVYAIEKTGNGCR